MKDKAREDYLRAMYRIYEKQEDKSLGIRAVEIAKSLDVSKPSVSAMVSKLSADGLVKAKPYNPIFFTKKGVIEARRITAKYRIIEVFLIEVLGYPRDLIREEAHRLEHAFSEESIKRISDNLHNPDECPHGKIIPRGADRFISLSKAEQGKKAQIKDIVAGLQLKKRLIDHAIYEGAEIEVVKNDAVGPIIIKVLDSRVCIGRRQARKILVEPHGKDHHHRTGRKPERR